MMEGVREAYRIVHGLLCMVATAWWARVSIPAVPNEEWDMVVIKEKEPLQLGQRLRGSPSGKGNK